MRIAYARVSTIDQNLDLQIDALKRAGYDKLFTDHGASGASADRTGLNDALAALNTGDTLLVWRLDRLARSVYDLADLLRDFNQRSIAFESICEGLDTSHYFGECMYLIAGAFAHLERCILIERTKEGMAAAKARGAKFGRKPSLTAENLVMARAQIDSGRSVADTAKDIGVGRSTLYRYLQAS
ncbi:MAG: recombinase family protein [Pseudomonadota bacterium]